MKGNMEYSEKLKDPRWQKKRLEILERDDWRCQKCLDGNTTLHVHHRKYLPNSDPWDYPDHLLITLCENCHADEKEIWAKCSSAFIEQFQEKFLGHHLAAFAAGIGCLKLQSVPDVVSAAYGFALYDAKMQSIILDKYFEWCKNAVEKWGKDAPIKIEKHLQLLKMGSDR